MGCARRSGLEPWVVETRGSVRHVHVPGERSIRREREPKRACFPTGVPTQGEHTHSAIPIQSLKADPGPAADPSHRSLQRPPPTPIPYAPAMVLPPPSHPRRWDCPTRIYQPLRIFALFRLHRRPQRVPRAQRRRSGVPLVRLRVVLLRAHSQDALTVHNSSAKHMDSKYPALALWALDRVPRRLLARSRRVGAGGVRWNVVRKRVVGLSKLRGRILSGLDWSHDHGRRSAGGRRITWWSVNPYAGLGMNATDSYSYSSCTGCAPTQTYLTLRDH